MTKHDKKFVKSVQKNETACQSKFFYFEKQLNEQYNLPQSRFHFFSFSIFYTNSVFYST